jgi:hypothetical protein
MHLLYVDFIPLVFFFGFFFPEHKFSHSVFFSYSLPATGGQQKGKVRQCVRRGPAPHAAGRGERG